MKKLKGMTTQQKIAYIRDYYTLHIIAAVVAVAAMGWALNHYVFNPPPRTFINISFYGQFVSTNLREILAEDLTAALVDEGANYIVFVDNFFAADDDPQFAMAMAQRMAAMMTAREIDIFIIGPGAAEGFIEAGFALDLHEVLTRAQLARLEDMGAVKTVESAPLGLRPAYLPYFYGLAQQFGGNFDGWTLIVMSNNDRCDAVQTFIDFITE